MASIAAPMATTLFGQLQGDWADSEKRIRVFKGVPYARPPVGELRFKPLRRRSAGRAFAGPTPLQQRVGNNTVATPLSGAAANFRAARTACI